MMEVTGNEFNNITLLVQEAIKYRNSGNFSKAMSSIHKAVEIGTEIKKPTIEYAHCLHVKAQLHQDQNELSKSFDDYYQAYKIYLATGNVSLAFHSLWHSAAVASENGRQKEAKTIFRKCLWMTQDVKLTNITQANFYRDLALHEERIDNLIGAYALWLHCLSLYEEANNNDGIQECKSRIQEILVKFNHQT